MVGDEKSRAKEEALREQEKKAEEDKFTKGKEDN